MKKYISHIPTRIFTTYKSLLCLIIIVGFILRLYKCIFEGLRGDEEVYAYLAWQISKGNLPYTDFFENNPPGVLYIMGLVFFLIEPNILFVRIFSSIIGSITCIFVYFLGKIVYNQKIGLISALLYNFDFLILFSSYHIFLDTFMNLFIVMGIYFAFIGSKALNSKYFLLSGVFIGLATFMKAPAIIEVLVILFFTTYLFKSKHKLKSSCCIKSILFLLIGVFSVLLGISLFYWLNNSFSEFFYAVVLYNTNTSSTSHSFFESLWLMMQRHGYGRLLRIQWVMKRNKSLWILGFFGVFYFIRRHMEEDIVILSYFIITFLFIISLRTLYFHYFIQIMPPLSILAGNLLYESYRAITSLEIKLNYKIIIVSLILTIITVVSIRDTASQYLFQDESQLTLEEQKIIAEYIILNTSPEEYVFAPKPGILFLSQRESPSKGFYFYDRGPLILISGEAANPSLLKEKRVRYSILTDEFFQRQSYSEVATYILSYYYLVKTFTFHGTSTYIYRAMYW